MGTVFFPQKEGLLRLQTRGPIVFSLFRHQPQAGVSQRDTGDKGFRHRLVPGSPDCRTFLLQKSWEFARKHGTFSGQKSYVFFENLELIFENFGLY
ncbi:MAG: hypothetical protein LBL81_02520 [Tannerella sp.]|nr:hypothetical protein [Tannerella sp.]